MLRMPEAFSKVLSTLFQPDSSFLLSILYQENTRHQKDALLPKFNGDQFEEKTVFKPVCSIVCKEILFEALIRSPWQQEKR